MFVHRGKLCQFVSIFRLRTHWNLIKSLQMPSFGIPAHFCGLAAVKAVSYERLTRTRWHTEAGRGEAKLRWTTIESRRRLREESRLMAGESVCGNWSRYFGAVTFKGKKILFLLVRWGFRKGRRAVEERPRHRGNPRFSTFPTWLKELTSSNWMSGRASLLGALGPGVPRKVESIYIYT